MEPSPNRVLALIAAFKLVKCALLAVLAMVAFGWLRRGPDDPLLHWLVRLPLAEGHGFVHSALVTLAGLPPHRADVLGAIAVGYSGLFGIEGIGLYRRRPWAEILTVVATASLLPFEAWALIEKLSLPRIAALAVNLSVVLYLLHVLRGKRRS